MWLKYASVYQPARIFSTGRSKIVGSSRLRVVIMFELQTRPAARPRRPRAARRSARACRAGAAARGRAWRARAQTGCAGWRVIQPKISVEAARAPSVAGRRGRPSGSAAGARSAARLPSAVVRSIGPTRCEPQRSCSFGRARRARSCRSRCARRRGTRRARRRAARARPARARAALVSSSRATGGSRERLTRPAGRPRCRPSTRARAGAPSGARASGSARLTCGRSANASASRAGPRRSGLRDATPHAGACAVRRPSARRRRSAPRTPRRGGRARARRSRAPCRRAGLCSVTAGSVAGARPAAAPRPGRERRRRSGVPSSATTGITSRIDEVDERLVGRAQVVERNAPSVAGVELEHERARDARQHARAERRV